MFPEFLNNTTSYKTAGILKNCYYGIISFLVLCFINLFSHIINRFFSLPFQKELVFKIIREPLI